MSGEDQPVILMTDPRVAGIASGLAEDFRLIHANDEAALARDAENVVAIVSTASERVGAALLERLPKLRLIAAVTAGIEGIDLEAARARGVAVTNAGAIGAEDVADHGTAMLLAARLRLGEGDRMVREGGWRGTEIVRMRPSLASERIGIVGMGAIGRALAGKLSAFSSQIGWWAPRPQELAWPRHESLIALARWSSILVLCARGDPQNRGMIDAEVIDAIGPDGLLVNIARGMLVDEEALIAALKAGRLGQAALDVFVDEPPAPESWQGVSNALLSPHVAGLTIENLQARRELITANVRTLLTGGELRNIIVPRR